MIFFYSHGALRQRPDVTTNYDTTVDRPDTARHVTSHGPLANGGTTLMFESLPTYPDAGRYWDLVQRHGVNQFYTAPTAIRALMKFGNEPMKKYDLSSLRVLGTVGEPINPEAWRFFFNEVGQGRCVSSTPSGRPRRAAT